MEQTRAEGSVRRTGRCGVFALMLLACAALVACGGGGDAAPTATANVETGPSPTPQPPATPPCDGEQRLTPATSEGANYRAASPERTSLIEPGVTGEKLTITGAVLSLSCRPVGGAVLDFWQADETGAFDPSGTRLRGRQTTGADGRYRLETIIPGAEAGRAPAIYVNVQAPGADVLTTRLYFAGDESNADDADFNEKLVMDVQIEGGEKVGGYDFVVRAP